MASHYCLTSQMLVDLYFTKNRKDSLVAYYSKKQLDAELMYDINELELCG